MMCISFSGLVCNECKSKWKRHAGNAYRDNHISTVSTEVMARLISVSINNNNIDDNDCLSDDNTPL